MELRTRSGGVVLRPKWTRHTITIAKKSLGLPNLPPGPCRAIPFSLLTFIFSPSTIPFHRPNPAVDTAHFPFYSCALIFPAMGVRLSVRWLLLIQMEADFNLVPPLDNIDVKSGIELRRCAQHKTLFPGIWIRKRRISSLAHHLQGILQNRTIVDHFHTQISYQIPLQYAGILYLSCDEEPLSEGASLPGDSTSDYDLNEECNAIDTIAEDMAARAD